MSRLSTSTLVLAGNKPFRSMPEFEEKYCTGCKDYWPCDPEFFRLTPDGWSRWCRACYAECVKRSRERSLSRRASNRGEHHGS